MKFIDLGGEMGTPRFSPDGKRLIFSGNSSGLWEIWSSEADGSGAARLTSMESYAGSPRWSSDGRRIAFDARPSGKWDVYVVAADGGAPLRLTAPSGENVRPSWSSDGRWIYFGSDRSGTAQVWKIPTGGGDARQVTKDGGYEAVESPDGKFIYYNRAGVSGLWRAPSGGGDETLLSDEFQWENSRNWIVTEQGIYFLASEDGSGRQDYASLRLFRFSTKRIERVAGLGKAQPANMGFAISPDGRWLLYVQRDETQTDIALADNFR